MSVRIHDDSCSPPRSYILGGPDDPNGCQLPEKLPRAQGADETLTFEEALRRYTAVVLSPFNVEPEAFKSHAPSYFKRELAEAEAALKASRK